MADENNVATWSGMIDKKNLYELPRDLLLTDSDSRHAKLMPWTCACSYKNKGFKNTCLRCNLERVSETKMPYTDVKCRMIALILHEIKDCDDWFFDYAHNLQPKQLKSIINKLPLKFFEKGMKHLFCHDASRESWPLKMKFYTNL